jgi:hypothetical protein
MLFLLDNLSHSMFCPVRPFSRSIFCMFDVLSHSTFCLIRHFGIRHFVPLDVLSIRRLLRHFVGEPILRGTCIDIAHEFNYKQYYLTIKSLSQILKSILRQFPIHNSIYKTNFMIVSNLSRNLNIILKSSGARNMTTFLCDGYSNS